MTATTVYEKIEKLKTIKADLKTNIESYGVTVGTAPFDEYPAKVLEIPTTDSIKTLIDAVNEESGGATIQDSIDLVDANYGDIKAAITAKGVDMAGVKPSGYDTAIASIVAASGDAVAGDILAGKTAATAAAGLITGTRPLVNIAVTGQTISSIGNDDGALRVGEPFPIPRFVDNLDNTVTDRLTNLMWTRDYRLSGAVAWDLALAAIADLNTTSYAGYTDWRPANIRELLTLFDYSTGIPSGHPFSPDPSSANVKSNTDAIGDATRALYVAFANGLVSPGLKSSGVHVWACRGPIAL